MLAALFIEADIFAGRAETFFADNDDTMIVSDFAAAEFASVVARLTRMNLIEAYEARAIFDGFDVWRARFANEEDAGSSDILAATLIIRQLNLNLRTPDAINLSIARRLGASLATFDGRMAENARVLGMAVADA